MEQFLSNLKDVAVTPTLISFIAIFLVGCVKLIPCVKNIKNKDARKALYQVLNIIFAGGLALGYSAIILHSEFNTSMIEFIGIVIAEVNVLYPLYENLGLRALLRKIASLVSSPRSVDLGDKENSVSTQDRPLTSAEVAAKQAKSEKTGWLK